MGSDLRRRWVAALVAGAVATTGLGTAAAEPSRQGATSPEGPTLEGNAFPVPAPFDVSYADGWHDCRDRCSRRHKGTDVMADEGTPLVAVESGVIAKVDDTDDGRGGLNLWLRGDSGVAYYYAHNAENLVRDGDRVEPGDVIARVGRTGNARATPPHVHVQVNLCGDLSSAEPCTVNPYPLLAAWQQAPVGRPAGDASPEPGPAPDADGVGWFRPSANVFARRTEVGSPLPPLEISTEEQDAMPVAGDWDGDGRDSVGVYERAAGRFRLLDDEGEALAPVSFGEPGRTDVWPLAGDFDGDGRDTVGLYRRADASFVVLVGEGVASDPVTLGEPGRDDAFPLVGDWDGDGRDALGVYRRADGVVVRLADDGAPLEPLETAPGEDAMPLAGDWDGDGRDEVALLRRSSTAIEIPLGAGPDRARPWMVSVGGERDVWPVAGDWNGRELVTMDDLRAIFGKQPDDRAVAAGLPLLNAAMARAGVSTPARKAAFLATLYHESGFRRDAVEAGRGDRFRGRGLIQLTGDLNYRAAGAFLGLDLVSDPERATEPRVSAAIAAWYWTVARDLNAAADALDMAAVNIGIGYRPSPQRDRSRCDSFRAAVRHFSGSEPGAVNCQRTPSSRALAFAGVMPFASRLRRSVRDSAHAAQLPRGARPSCSLVALVTRAP